MIELNKIYCENCLDTMARMPDNSIDCCVTSPPYYGLRDYGVDGQIGLEKTPEEYINKITEIFSEVKRTLKPEGTLWLNLGDSYVGSTLETKSKRDNSPIAKGTISSQENRSGRGKRTKEMLKNKLKPKDLIGIPWMVAFALRADGWYLRQDIIWSKPNPMPESVKDRCTKSHEYIFLLTKSKKYYYDAEAIKEDAIWADGPNAPDKIKSPYGQGFTRQNYSTPTGWDNELGPHGTIHRNGRTNKKSKRKGPQTFGGKKARDGQDNEGDPRNMGRTDKNSQWGKVWDSDIPTRNKRSVWNVATTPYKEAHFAVFPEMLIVDCIKAGCPEGGIVYDPFAGSGTTAKMSHLLKRNWIGSELNKDYVDIANKRLQPYLDQKTLF